MSTLYQPSNLLRCTGLLALLGLVCVGCDDGDSGDADATTVGGGGAGGGGGTVLEDAGPAPDASEQTEDAGNVAEMDAGAGGAAGPACPPGGFGLLAEPGAGTESESASHSPRVVWTGSGWGAVWVVDGADGEAATVRFRRFGGDGSPVGEAVDLGRTDRPRLGLAWNGGGFVAVWDSTRGGGEDPESMVIQTIGPGGDLIGAATPIEDTLDVDAFSLSWATGLGGMLVYSRGSRGADGLWARPIDEGGVPGAAVQVSDASVAAADVAYGDGSWGAVWLDRGSEMNPSDVVFSALDEAGAPVGSLTRIADAGAQAAIHLAFIQGNFGLAWSAVTEMGQLQLRLTLLDASGELLATPDIGGPSGFGLATDLVAVPPDNFIVAWQDTRTDGRAVGVTRANVLGVTFEPVTIDDSGGAETLGVAGNLGNLGAFYTLDPEPPLDGHSPGTEIVVGRLGPCN